MSGRVEVGSRKWDKFRIKRLEKILKKNVSAIFCADDTMAFGCQDFIMAFVYQVLKYGIDHIY